MSDSCSENTDFLVSLPSDFFQVHTSDSETVEDTVTEELSISSNSFKGVIDNLVTNLDTLSNQINEIEQMETSYISNGLSSPLSASSPLKRNAERKINYSSIDSLMHEMVNTYEYNDKLLRNIDNGNAQRNVSFQEKDVRSPVTTKKTVSGGLEDNNLKSLCDDLENVTPRVNTALNDYQKLDSVSKENLWLKLGKEIYRRQNIEKKVIDLEEKLTNYEKRMVEYKEVDCQKNNLLDDLAARSAMILSQVRAYSTINEKINRDLQSERKNKKEILETMKEKIEHYKSDTAKAISRSNSYKARTENAEKKLNELLIKCQRVEEQTKQLQLSYEKKNEENELLQNELFKLQEQNISIAEKCNRSINKCNELEKEVIVLNQEKKVLCEKTLKYDQLLDQKRRIEDIVDQMKNTEAQTAEELNAAKEEIKTVKNDLKSFYQKQLDAMLAEKVSDYQRKLDGIVQITNEENKLIKLQMNNQIINFKERYEKEKTQLDLKHRGELEHFEILIKDKLECISALEKRLEAEVQEKRQLVKSVMGVVKNVNIDSQSNSKLNSDIKYQRKKSINNSNSSSKLEDDFSFFEQEHLLHQVTPTELRKHIEILLNKYPGNPLVQK
ncbi:microtubule-associated tumor suppressor 1 homolog [Metopolophium dirhodum]|uniref:microtubule-associated tumor suppressor 1 homolog n=1 Tax=Metopolophium dirhodum TaxID=44670 RepID=UPI00298FF182|nr:microtubule-associated tumor suppressor 1 homolog [Metopolophium dirhodum]